MIDCTHLPYQAIRTADQNLIAKDLLHTARAQSTKHFIRQLIRASWSSNGNTSRIWLGLWNEHTLRSLLTQSLEARMTLQTRKAYISIARKLTAPLLSAYYQMRTITHTQAKSTRKTDKKTSLHPTTRNILEHAYIQMPPSTTTSLLNNLDSTTNTSTFTLSDAAFALTDAADDT